LSNGPRLKREQRNETAPIIFIDTLYDAHARLVISSEGARRNFPPKGAPPEAARAAQIGRDAIGGLVDATAWKCCGQSKG
jgi:hypothetical protein